jgi:putative FmdB family regulatory protein
MEAETLRRTREFRVPLYEYQCKKCRHKFEKIQQFSDAPVKKCPKCGGPVEQLLSAPAVQFKGSGWYVTDYARRGGSDKSKGSDSESSSSSSDKDGAKATEKSETKKKESKTESKPKK